MANKNFFEDHMSEEMRKILHLLDQHNDCFVTTKSRNNDSVAVYCVGEATFPESWKDRKNAPTNLITPDNRNAIFHTRMWYECQVPVLKKQGYPVFEYIYEDLPPAPPVELPTYEQTTLW